MKHLLGIEGLSREEVERILDRAESFAEVGKRDIKKVPTLRGRTIVNLFYEASTRTLDLRGVIVVVPSPNWTDAGEPGGVN